MELVGLGRKVGGAVEGKTGGCLDNLGMGGNKPKTKHYNAFA